jgi:epoxyqueuosine reductase
LETPVTNQEVEQEIIRLGASLVGFGDVVDVLPTNLSHLPCAISIGVKLSGAIVDEVASGPTEIYRRHYGIVNRHLDNLSLQTAMLLERAGHRAMPLPATYEQQRNTLSEEEVLAQFSHKTAATKAGLGWIGKCALLVSYAYGPRVRFVTVLTDASFETGNPILESECKSCHLCADRCPAGAVRNTNWIAGMARGEMFDAEACWKHMRYMNGQGGMVCGICVAVCPKGMKKR